MVHTANIPRPQRAAALMIVILMHALLLLFFFITRWQAPAPAQTPGALTVVSVADQSAATLPPPPKLPSKVVLEDVVELAEIALAAEANPNGAAASASACPTLEVVSKALLSDPLTVAAVRQAPPETRSIAEAIVIWNSGWSPATATIGAPLERVRVNVSQSLESIDEACLDEPVAGPRLVPIPAGEGTMFLVFGSGSWTWRQLILDPQPMMLAGPEAFATRNSAPAPAIRWPWN
ncbi:MAG: hypothetical protein M3438_10420 [Pseudomonadota bacterium]|nr:hypothetical protein [Pseudomonadota bacterium]